MRNLLFLLVLGLWIGADAELNGSVFVSPLERESCLEVRRGCGNLMSH